MIYQEAVAGQKGDWLDSDNAKPWFISMMVGLVYAFWIQFADDHSNAGFLQQMLASLPLLWLLAVGS